MARRQLTQNWASDESIYLLRTLTDLQGHYNSLISSNYQDSLKLLDMLNETRSRWHNESVENSQLKTKIERLDRQNNEITNQVRKLTEELSQAKTRIASLLLEKCHLENELRAYKNQFKQLQNEEDQSDPVIVKLINLNLIRPIQLEECSNALITTDTTMVENVETEIESSTLKTMENIVDNGSRARSGGRPFVRTSKQPRKEFCARRSKSHQATKRINFVGEKVEENGTINTEGPSPPKRSKETGKITATTIFTIDSEGKQPTKVKVTIRRSLKRSLSERNFLDARQEHKPTMNFALSTNGLRTPLPGFGSSWTNGQPIEKRQHNFKPFSAFMASCDVCLKYLYSKKALRCTDCHLRFHADCIRPLPMPCLPLIEAPKTPKKQRPRLQDFCPNQHPMIPPLLIRCVIALERGNIIQDGIYRSPGEEARVENLLSQLKSSKICPNLVDYETECLTGCIKKFLKDPLIPSTSWSEFVLAAESDTDDQLNYAILELPAPNRDTLAYMCIHWQNVVKNANSNQMSIDRLVECLGPIVVGYSKQSTLGMDTDRGRDNKKQEIVMKRLLQMPPEYWRRFIKHNLMSSNTPNRNLTPRAPLNRPETPREASQSRGKVVRHIDFAADQSFLGPVTKASSSNGPDGMVTRRPTGNYFEKPY